MARTRSIKPSFFTNESLADCSPLARLLFIGLWTVADREGRLEDRPRRINAELLPYDGADCDKLLSELASRGFIMRYEVDGNRYISIGNFAKHQHCHVKENASAIPAPDLHQTSTSLASTQPALLPSTFNPLPSTLLPTTEGESIPDEPPPPPPPKESSSKGTRLPKDWVLPKDWGEWALEQGATRETILRESEKFRDHWHATAGQKAVKADWKATWRTWIRRTMEGNHNGTNQQGGGYRNEPTKDDRAKAAVTRGVMEYFAELEAEQGS